MTRVPFLGGEREMLRASLDRHRDVVLWKLEGLDDEQLRRAVVPSGTCALGLVKHLAAVDHAWFCDTFGRDHEPLPFGDQVSLRWVLLHMVEETARHAGHLDIVRELLDGTTGDHRPA